MLVGDAITSGLEGIMAKRLDSKYQAGARNFNWITSVANIYKFNPFYNPTLINIKTWNYALS